MNIQKDEKGSELMANVRKTILLPSEIVKKIEKYQKENYLTSFTSAVVQLVIVGLEQKGAK